MHILIEKKLEHRDEVLRAHASTVPESEVVHLVMNHCFEHSVLSQCFCSVFLNIHNLGFSIKEVNCDLFQQQVVPIDWLVVEFDGHVKDSGQTVADMPMGFCFFVALSPPHTRTSKAGQLPGLQR